MDFFFMILNMYKVNSAMKYLTICFASAIPRNGITLKFLALFWIVLILFPCFTFAQEDEPKIKIPTDVIGFEEHYTAADSDTVQINILYRIRYDYFIFSKPTSNHQTNYTAHGEVVIELLDSTETSIARHFNSLTFDSDDNTIAHLRAKYAQGCMSFTLPKGKYTAIYQIEDKESQKQPYRNKQVLQTQKYLSASNIRSSFTFVQPIASLSDSTQFEMLNLAGNAIFAKNFGVVFSLKNTVQPPTIRYTLQQLRPEKTHILFADTTVAVSVRSNAVLSFREMQNNKIVADGKHSSSNALAYFTVQSEHVPQGRYLLTIYLPAPDTATLSTTFSLLWLTMPVSLNNLDLAISVTRYITTADDFSNLQSGSRATRIEKFEKFWKQRDPTPTTAYNEQLAEYFRRVDYAFVAFRTLRDENGALTDRGKIYILYGAPNSTERVLATSGSPKEIWKYKSLNKQFVFEDPTKQGNYKLILSEK